jgi:catechol 2,3-dioxygenase-like lactoylglutathione lyase family enzyme
MSIKGIDHWVIVAGDLRRTLDFYARLGFTIAWEKRPGRPDMATIRINDAQKINVHAPDAPAQPGYLGARRPSVGGADFCLEWDCTVDEVLALLKNNGIAVEAGPGPRTCARGVSRASTSAIPTTIWSSSRCTTAERSVALRQAEHVLGEMVEHHLLGHRRDLVEPHLAPETLDVELLRVAVATVRL